MLAFSFRLHIRRASAAYSPLGPGARANVCDSDVSTLPSSLAHGHLQDTWRAWVRRDGVASSRCALQRPGMGMGIGWVPVGSPRTWMLP